jgi:hypothetical protein
MQFMLMLHTGRDDAKGVQSWSTEDIGRMFQFLIGFWIVECDGPERAYEIAARASASASPGLGGAPLGIPIEVRPSVRRRRSTGDPTVHSGPQSLTRRRSTQGYSAREECGRTQGDTGFLPAHQLRAPDYDEGRVLEI